MRRNIFKKINSLYLLDFCNQSLKWFLLGFKIVSSVGEKLRPIWSICSPYYSSYMKPVRDTNSEPGLPVVQIKNCTLYTYYWGKGNSSLYLGLNSLYRGSTVHRYWGKKEDLGTGVIFGRVTTGCRRSYKDPPEPAFLPHDITHAQSFFSPATTRAF